MLSFIWSDPLPLYSGRGGTESYTIGHIRELLDRGIEARILTYGHGDQDGREFHPGIPFETIDSIESLSKLDDTLIFINIPHAIPTKRPAFVMFHFPPLREHGEQEDFVCGIARKTLMVNSRFLQGLCADFLNIPGPKLHVVYPFADPAFAAVKRPENTSGKTRVLFAGRLNPEKGIYTFLESLHHDILADGFSFSVTTAGNESPKGKVLESLIRAHPLLKIYKARHNPKEMAKLFARHDVVVMPSNHHYWHEGFGMISVEAQHAGCRLIASDDGGLPETDCGSLRLVQPGNSMALAEAILEAAQAGPVPPEQRERATTRFTRKQSVDTLLAIIEQARVRSKRS